MAPHPLSIGDKIENINVNEENHGNCLLGQEGSFLVDILPRGDTTNAAAYCETLKRLRQAIQNKLRGILTRGLCLLHDNARAHTARVTQELLQTTKWDV
jgi:hypothetical protein